MSIKSRIPYCYGDIPSLKHTISPMTVEQYLHVEEKYFSFMENNPSPSRILLQHEVAGLLPRLRSSLGNWKLWNSGDISTLEDVQINSKDKTDSVYSVENPNEAGDGSIIKDVLKTNNQASSSSTSTQSSSTTPSSSTTTTAPTVDDYPAHLNPFDDQFTGDSITKEVKPQPKSSRILKSIRKVLSRPFKMCLNRK